MCDAYVWIPIHLSQLMIIPENVTQIYKNIELVVIIITRNGLIYINLIDSCK